MTEKQNETQATAQAVPADRLDVVEEAIDTLRGVRSLLQSMAVLYEREQYTPYDADAEFALLGRNVESAVRKLETAFCGESRYPADSSAA